VTCGREACGLLGYCPRLFRWTSRADHTSASTPRSPSTRMSAARETRSVTISWASRNALGRGRSLLLVLHPPSVIGRAPAPREPLRRPCKEAWTKRRRPPLSSSAPLIPAVTIRFQLHAHLRLRQLPGRAIPKTGRIVASEPERRESNRGWPSVIHGEEPLSP
jgi:hypothetical protein